jgi:hypothetical protein
MHFVVGHPRSGTALTAELLNAGTPGVAAHEHLVALSGLGFVTAATEYYQGSCDRRAILDLMALYGRDGVGVDSNWKLTWTADCLRVAFPDARVLHLVREPRANVDACMALDYYGDALTGAPPEAMRAALLEVVGRSDVDLGPFRVWLAAFPRVRRDDWDALSAYERNCAFWTETHRLILEHLADRPGYKRVRLEELRDPQAVSEVAGFFGLPAPTDAAARRILGTRVNDHSRLARLVAALRRRGGGPPASIRRESEAQADLCGEMARRLGY